MPKNDRISAEFETPSEDMVALESGVRVSKKRMAELKRRRSRRMEASVKRLHDEVTKVSDEDIEGEPTREIPCMSVTVPEDIPESRQTIQMAVPPFPETVRDFDEPEPVSRTTREVLAQHGIIPITASCIEDAFRKLTGDPHAQCPSDPEVERLLGLDAYASRAVELCDDCDILTEAIAIKALHILPNEAIILPPLVMTDLIETMAVDPVNPLGFCIGCGKHMDPHVEKADPLKGQGLPAACCNGMQKAIQAGRAALPVEKYLDMGSFAVLRGTLISSDGERSITHDHCGWCGGWFQTFLMQARIGHIDNGWELAATA